MTCWKRLLCVSSGLRGCLPERVIFFFFRNILASLIANGFSTPLFLPADPARARLDPSPQRIARDIP